MQPPDCKAQNLWKDTGGAAVDFMYTHGCVFPREAEKGVGAGPVSHVLQN